MWLAAAGCKQLFGLDEPVVRDGGGSNVDTRPSNDVALRDGIGLDSLSSDGSVGTIALVQYHFATGMGNQFTVTYQSAQRAGDLNVIAVGWEAASLITSLTDTAGNTYSTAAQTTSGMTNETIYYSCNIAAATNNHVTVQFSLQSPVDLRIAEYSGLVKAGCWDGAVESGGTATTESSTALQTTRAPVLLFAANMTTQTTTAADPMFTNRGITNDGDLVEDRVVTTIGTYQATATQNMTGTWVMELVGFAGQ